MTTSTSLSNLLLNNCPSLAPGMSSSIIPAGRGRSAGYAQTITGQCDKKAESPAEMLLSRFNIMEGMPVQENQGLMVVGPSCPEGASSCQGWKRQTRWPRIIQEMLPTSSGSDAYFVQDKFALDFTHRVCWAAQIHQAI